MIHQYKSNGYNIVMDVNSGSVHVVDDIVYTMIPLIEPLIEEGVKDPDTIKAAVLNLAGISGPEQEITEAVDEVLELEKNEIVIFEGIHALNDQIAGRHPEAAKLYISARSNVNEGAVLRFKGTWMRLTRRAVRDYSFRGTGVAQTLEMWANVRRGEKLYISPFKSKADIVFDSSLPYEVPVMKN